VGSKTFTPTESSSWVWLTWVELYKGCKIVVVVVILL